MWTKRVYSDSYLTSRPARSAGRTASFNFTTPVASEKCASSVCIKTGVSKGGGKHEKESRVAKMRFSQNITAVFLATSEGGPVLSRAAMTSSFFRIQVHPVPHLPPQAADAKKKKRLRFSARGEGHGGKNKMCNCRTAGQFEETQLPSCHCEFVCLLLGCSCFLWLLLLWQLKWPASACRENPGSPSWMGKHPQGGEKTTGWLESLTSSKCRLPCFC